MVLGFSNSFLLYLYIIPYQSPYRNLNLHTSSCKRPSSHTSSSVLLPSLCLSSSLPLLPSPSLSLSPPSSLSRFHTRLCSPHSRMSSQQWGIRRGGSCHTYTYGKKKKKKKKKRGSEESTLEDEEIGMEKEEERRSRYPMCRIFTGLVEWEGCRRERRESKWGSRSA